MVINMVKKENVLYNKKDIMNIFSCESDKVLRILRLLYSMKEATKIGREYDISKESFDQFVEDMKGKEVII